MRFLTTTLAVITAGCAGLSYEPTEEQSFAQIAEDGCEDRGRQFIVEARVNKAYENNVVLWDGRDPNRTISAILPGRGPLSRVRGWFGESKHELSQEQLSQLSTSGRPVTVTLECRGENVAPVVRNLSYREEDGTRVAIGF